MKDIILSHIKKYTPNRGAGYSSGIAKRIDDLLGGTRSILSNCHCENACQEYLKHYRNQIYHSVLDRFAAIELLNWAKSGALADDIPSKRQKKMFEPLRRILSDYGIVLRESEERIFVESDRKCMQLNVYPSMRVKPSSQNIIYVSDFEVKYARAYAVDMITNNL